MKWKFKLGVGAGEAGAGGGGRGAGGGGRGAGGIRPEWLGRVEVTNGDKTTRYIQGPML
jgi:hypothetical protein